jgi:hypothetical protein
MLSAKHRALILPVAYRVDTEISKSKRIENLKTTRSWQAHYIKFVMALGQDPCTVGTVADCILSSYTKLLIEGKNIKNRDMLLSDTIRGYL